MSIDILLFSNREGHPAPAGWMKRKKTNSPIRQLAERIPRAMPVAVHSKINTDLTTPGLFRVRLRIAA